MLELLFWYLCICNVIYYNGSCDDHVISYVIDHMIMQKTTLDELKHIVGEAPGMYVITVTVTIVCNRVCTIICNDITPQWWYWYIDCSCIVAFNDLRSGQQPNKENDLDHYPSWNDGDTPHGSGDEPLPLMRVSQPPEVQQDSVQ